MPTVLLPIEQFINQPVHSIAVVVCEHKQSEFLHSGIVYKYKGASYFIHLASHKNLKCENLLESKDEYKFFIYTNFLQLIKFDPHFFRRKALIAYLQALYEKNKNTIPYSFLFKISPFDKDKSYNKSFGQYGLTCSTFVMAVFESNGIGICEKETWPEREDDIIIRRRIISAFREDPRIPQEHIQILENEISCIRFRPEEVFCATTKIPLPCNFNDTQGCSQKVLANINSN